MSFLKISGCRWMDATVVFSLLFPLVNQRLRYRLLVVDHTYMVQYNIRRPKEPEFAIRFVYSMAEHQEITWEKPAWTKGAGLRKTGRGDAVKQGGNLAAPITDLPHVKKEGATNFSKPGWTDEAAEKEKPAMDLAKPVTKIREIGDSALEFQKPDWTQKKVLKESDKGEALKTGKEIARPIGGIKPVDE